MNRRVNYNSSKNKRTGPVNKRANKRTAATSTLAPAATDRPSSSELLQQLQAWLLHHQFSCKDSLLKLLHNPWQSMMTWMVVAIALVLPAMLYLGLQNVQQLGHDTQHNSQLSAYVRYQAKPLAIHQLQQQLASYAEIQSVQVITPEAAKLEFQAHSGLGEVIDSLDANPLPTVMTLLPQAQFRTPEQLVLLQQKVALEPLVEQVQLDIAWLRRLQGMIQLVEKVVFILAILLVLGVLLIIANTIRLAIENRRSEIVVVKMVGGTDGFVRRPFLYTGFWYGMGGAIMALLLLLLVGAWLHDPIANLTSLYESKYSLSWLGFNTAISIMILASLSGWLGAWVAVSRHLKGIEPE